MTIAQRVWHTADITITHPDGAEERYGKHRFLAIPGEPLRVMDPAGNVKAEFPAHGENEVSDRLVTYHGPGGITWHVVNKAGGCGSCGGQG
jgi:hypothetical protein